jgi:hypothetical protein
LNNEENPLDFINILKDAIKCGFNLLFFRLISPPVVGTDVLNGLVNFEGEFEDVGFFAGAVGASCLGRLP